MILMRILPVVREDQIRLKAALERFEPRLDLLAFRGKKAIPELLYVYAGACGA
jgi:hypothetical protein